jgi:hypothetical protein
MDTRPTCIFNANQKPLKFSCSDFDPFLGAVTVSPTKSIGHFGPLLLRLVMAGVDAPRVTSFEYKNSCFVR